MGVVSFPANSCVPKLGLRSVFWHWEHKCRWVSVACVQQPLHTSCRPASSWAMLFEPTFSQSRKDNSGETRDIPKSYPSRISEHQWLSRIWFEVLGINPMGMDEVNQKTGRKAVLDQDNKSVLFVPHNVFKNTVIWWHLKIRKFHPKKKKNQFPASFEKLEDIATLVPCFHLAILRGNWEAMTTFTMTVSPSISYRFHWFHWSYLPACSL